MQHRGFKKYSARRTADVATTSTPVPHTFEITTSPMATGAAARARLISVMQSKIRPFGIASRVLTETKGLTPPVTATVEVTILVGFITSCRA